MSTPLFEPVPEFVRKRLERASYSNSTDHPFSKHHDQIVRDLRAGKHYLVIAGKGYKAIKRSNHTAFLKPADGSLIPCGEVTY